MRKKVRLTMPLVTLAILGFQVSSAQEAISGPSFHMDPYCPAQKRIDDRIDYTILVNSNMRARESNDNTLQIRNEIFKMLEHDSCPTRKELENSLKAVFEISTPNKPYESRIAKPNSDSSYEFIWLKLPPTISGPSQLFLVPRLGSTDITKDMVEEWFGTKEAIFENFGLVYEYPWGEVEFKFIDSHIGPSILVIYRWFKSSESDGVANSPVYSTKRLNEKLAKIDLAYANGERKRAFEDLYWQVGSWSTLEHSTDRLRYLTALRERLITWNQQENKPEVVAYLRTASFNEIIETMHQIYRNRRQDFFTATEQANFQYHAYGQLDQEYKGSLTILGFDDAPIIEIEGDSAAVKQFLNFEKITLPFKTEREHAITLSTLPGALIDQIAEEKDAITVKHSAELEASLKAKYIEDSKDPDKVKLRELQNRRDALDPERVEKHDGPGTWH